MGFRDACDQYANSFRCLDAVGRRRVVLAGAGELAEIAILAARHKAVEVVVVLDAETNCGRVAGVPVVRNQKEAPAFDAVVVTDARTPQASYDRLRG
jgi:L-amino acid N-acyltransferase YncA